MSKYKAETATIKWKTDKITYLSLDLSVHKRLHYGLPRTAVIFTDLTRTVTVKSAIEALSQIEARLK